MVNMIVPNILPVQHIHNIKSFNHTFKSNLHRHQAVRTE